MDGKDWQLLRTAPVFLRLNDSPIEALIAGQQPRVAKKGTLLFHQGHSATHAFVVFDGWVRLFTTSKTGAEAIIHVARPGELLGVSAFFLDDGYPFSAEVISPARVLSIRRDRLLALMHGDPRLAGGVIQALAVQIRDMVQHVEELKVLNGEQRMAEFLIEHCSAPDGVNSLALPFEKALIAGYLGMQPASLSRAFARLRKLGVRVEGNVVSLPVNHKLAELVERTRVERQRRHAWRRRSHRSK